MKKSFEINFKWEDYFVINNNIIQQKENSEIEFKETFHSPKNRNKKLLKWIASFANAKGGLIIYGVKNNGEIIGLKDSKLKNFDNKDLSQELLNFFSPEIKFELFIKKIEKYNLGFLYIYESEDKPVISIKSSDVIQEGDIYYRYPGESKKISYADLKKILEYKYIKLNEKWLNIINNIATIGVENIGLLNIEKGEIIGANNKLLISEELLKKVKFINEGNFNEKEGAPTLKLIGEVIPINSNKTIKVVEKEYKVITSQELYKAFLNNNLEGKNARSFFRKVLYENSPYYPIYYYLYKSKLAYFEIENILKSEKGNNIEKIKKRLETEKTNYYKFKSGNLNTGTTAADKIKEIYDLLKNQKEIKITGVSSIELRYIIQGITHLKESEIKYDYIISLLNKIYDAFFKPSSKSITKTFIRKAICHIDLLIYGKLFFEKQD